VESLENRSVNQRKLNDLKRKVDKVMEEIPEILSSNGTRTWDGSLLSAIGKLFTRGLPVANTCMSAIAVSRSLSVILDKFEAISREAIYSFSK